MFDFFELSEFNEDDFEEEMLIPETLFETESRSETSDVSFTSAVLVLVETFSPSFC